MLRQIFINEAPRISLAKSINWWQTHHLQNDAFYAIMSNKLIMYLTVIRKSMIRSLVTFSLRPAIWQILIPFMYVHPCSISHSIIFPSQSQISDTITRTMYLSLKRESMLSRLKVPFLVPRLTLFALRSLHLGCDFLLFLLRHDLAAATTSHLDIIQRPSGSAYAITRKRRRYLMMFLVMMSSVLFHSNLRFRILNDSVRIRELLHTFRLIGELPVDEPAWFIENVWSARKLEEPLDIVVISIEFDIHILSISTTARLYRFKYHRTAIDRVAVLASFLTQDHLHLSIGRSLVRWFLQWHCPARDMSSGRLFPGSSRGNG